MICTYIHQAFIRITACLTCMDLSNFLKTDLHQVLKTLLLFLLFSVFKLQAQHCIMRREQEDMSDTVA